MKDNRENRGEGSHAITGRRAVCKIYHQGQFSRNSAKILP